MTWEQFLVLAEVFQNHIRNVHHWDVFIPGMIMAGIAIKIYLENKKIRIALEAIAESLGKR